MSRMINGLFYGEIQPTVMLAGNIAVYENIWPNPDKTIERVEKECADPDSGAYWRRAETHGQGAHQTHRTNKVLDITHLATVNDNKYLQNLHNQFNMLLMAASIPYANRCQITEPLFHEGYCLLKYSDDQEYKQHYDTDTSGGRIISCLCYLNNDFEGGELEFPNFDIKIKPQPGMLILFPSNYAYTHIAHPVTSGNKYALVTWIKDRDN